MSALNRIRSNLRARIRRRFGRDDDSFIIPNRRVYILPTRLGLIFSGLLFLMFVGSLNYANNLALGLTFLLGALATIAMHHCHRNLVGIRVNHVTNEPVFAGEIAKLHVALSSSARINRYEIRIGRNEEDVAILIRPDARSIMAVSSPTSQRGRVTIDEVVISTRFPFGLFRAWTYVYMPLSCIVYPKPATHATEPPTVHASLGNTAENSRGDDDFNGLRGFQFGDSPRRIAWKQYAHGQALQTKLFSTSSSASRQFDFDSLIGLDVESRLSTLCRWIEDSYNAQQSFGLTLPGMHIEVQSGYAHRQRCLTALALFGIDSKHASKYE